MYVTSKCRACKARCLFKQIMFELSKFDDLTSNTTRAGVHIKLNAAVNTAKITLENAKSAFEKNPIICDAKALKLLKSVLYNLRNVYIIYKHSSLKKRDNVEVCVKEITDLSNDLLQYLTQRSNVQATSDNDITPPMPDNPKPPHNHKEALSPGVVRAWDFLWYIIIVLLVSPLHLSARARMSFWEGLILSIFWIVSIFIAKHVLEACLVHLRKSSKLPDITKRRSKMMAFATVATCFFVLIPVVARSIDLPPIDSEGIDILWEIGRPTGYEPVSVSFEYLGPRLRSFNIYFALYQRSQVQYIQKSVGSVSQNIFNPFSNMVEVILLNGSSMYRYNFENAESYILRVAVNSPLSAGDYQVIAIR